jgi:hypothetical protein
MIYTNHITAKGMPAQAAAGQCAPMLIPVGIWFGVLRSMRRALECSQVSVGGFARMFGLSNSASMVYAVSKPINCTVAGFGYSNPPRRYDNSPGEARLKLR